MRPAAFQQGIVRKLSPQKLHQLMGEIVTLLMLSSVHRNYQVRDLSDILLPAINLNQFRIYRNAAKQPVALVTWGRLSEAVEKRYLAGKMVLTEDELRSGDRLYFMDFIAPYGHAKEVIRDLRTQIFPNDCAHSLRVYGTGNGRTRMLKFRGVHYKRVLN